MGCVESAGIGIFWVGELRHPAWHALLNLASILTPRRVTPHTPWCTTNTPSQAHHFFRYAPLKIPYGIKRYIEETERLYSVLEDGLSAGKGEWLVGDKYSIADINVAPWVFSHWWAGVDVSKFPKLAAWVKRIQARPAVKLGRNVPSEPRTPSKEDEEKSYKEAGEWIEKANAELAAAKK